MSKTSISNGVLIDEYCEHKNSELVKFNNVIYSCTLNQTDLKTNKNKFYIMQLLKNATKYIHYVRYGRIGEIGKITYNNCDSESSAISSFEKLFRTKTGNKWSDKDKFVAKTGKYFLSEITYDDISDKIKDDKPINIPDSKLHPKVQELLKTIGDVDMMKRTLITLDIDPKKMPLGKLSKTQLDKANEILDSINDLINKGQTKTDDIIDLSSKYYTYIPYCCGRNVPPSIDDLKILGKYRNVIDELRNIVVSAQIINVKHDDDVNPLDAIYSDINTTIKHIGNKSKIYKEIEKWIKNTHGPTHGCKLELVDVFELGQDHVKKVYDEATKDIDNRTLLFHGTHQSCVLSIFKNNFYLDPTKLKNGANIQIAGKMFGYGVYFADVATKSFNYTRAQSTNDIGCLLVGEIALGNVSERTDSDYNINKNNLANINCHSAKGLGQWAPSTSTTIKGVKLPNGPLGDTKVKNGLRYNEYMVYDVNQILMKYLVLVKNTGNYNGY